MLQTCPLAFALLLASTTVAANPPAPANPDEHLHFTPAIPATPAAALEVIAIRPFVLDASYVHEWRKERPAVDAGFILVLRFDADLLYPRQVAAPILMVGEQTIETVNVGYPAGVIVGLLPAPRGKDGTPQVDFMSQPIQASAPGLPEAVDAAAARERRDAALAANLQPLTGATVTAARAKGGELLRIADRAALDRELGKLLRQYAPTESERADALEGVTDPTPRHVVPGGA